MPGHILVITRRHVETIIDLTLDEEAAIGHSIARSARAIRLALDPAGILVQQHNGADAFQTVPHVHVHVIPKAKGSPFPPSEEAVVASEERRSTAALLRHHWG
jgi:histidine triad (HIT) family protein